MRPFLEQMNYGWVAQVHMENFIKDLNVLWSKGYNLWDFVDILFCC